MTSGGTFGCSGPELYTRYLEEKTVVYQRAEIQPSLQSPEGNEAFFPCRRKAQKGKQQCIPCNSCVTGQKIVHFLALAEFSMAKPDIWSAVYCLNGSGEVRECFHSKSRCMNVVRSDCKQTFTSCSSQLTVDVWHAVNAMKL